MLHIVGADADRIQFLIIQHGLMIRIEVNAFHAVALKEGLGLSGNQIRAGHDFHIGHALVAFDMGFGDPTGADDAHAQLFTGANRLRDLFLFFELAQDFVSNSCHSAHSPFLKSK